MYTKLKHSVFSVAFCLLIVWRERHDKQAFLSMKVVNVCCILQNAINVKNIDIFSNRLIPVEIRCSGELAGVVVGVSNPTATKMVLAKFHFPVLLKQHVKTSLPVN